MKVCTSCNASNNDDAKYCMICGEELTVSHQEQSVKPQKPLEAQQAAESSVEASTVSVASAPPIPSRAGSSSQEHALQQSLPPHLQQSQCAVQPQASQHPRRAVQPQALPHMPVSHSSSQPVQQTSTSYGQPQGQEYRPSFDFEQSQQVAAQTFKKFTGVVPACLRIIDNGRWLAFAGYIQIVCLSIIAIITLFIFAFGASLASSMSKTLIGSLALMSLDSSKSNSTFGRSSSAYAASSSSGGFTSFFCGIIALLFVGFIIHLAIIRWKSFRGKDASGDERTLRALGLFLRIPSEYVIIVSIGCYVISLVTAISYGGFAGFLSMIFILPGLALWLMFWLVGAFVFGRIIEIMANSVGRLERIEAKDAQR